MKYTKNLILIFFLLFLFTACEKDIKIQKTPEKKTIGVSMASMKQDFFKIIKEAMMDIREQENIEIIWLDAEEKKEKQEENISKLIKEKVDTIIINPVDCKETAKEIEKIKNAKIPVVAIDRIIRNVKLDAYISSDSFGTGTEQARYLAEQIDGQGKILILKGDKNDNVSQEITAGNKDVLRKTLRIDIVAEEWHEDWSPELAADTVRKALEAHPDLQGILANNSDMAMAAIKVLKEKNLLDQVTTIGADASKEACLAIAKDEHTADIDTMPYVLGLSAIKTAVFIARDEIWNYDINIKNGDYDLPVIVTPIMLINKFNLVVMRDRWPELYDYIKTVK